MESEAASVTVPAYQLPPVPPKGFGKHRILYIVLGTVVLLFIATVGYVAYLSKGHPVVYVESTASILLMPSELKQATFSTAPKLGSELFQIKKGRLGTVVKGVTGSAVRGTHLAVVHGGPGTSSAVLDGNDIAKSGKATDFFVAPALNQDASLFAWTVLSATSVANFSDGTVTVHDLATDKEQTYAGIAPFFTADGELGRFGTEGIALTNLSTGATRLLPKPDGVSFTSADIHPASLVASPDGMYVGWVTRGGEAVVMHVGNGKLEPVLSEKTSVVRFALSNDAVYIVIREKANVFMGDHGVVIRTSLLDKHTSKYYLPQFPIIASLVL